VERIHLGVDFGDGRASTLLRATRRGQHGNDDDGQRQTM
jgi:hypothetical protein